MANAASRVHAILQKAQQTNPNFDGPCAEVWAEVAGLNGNTLVPKTSTETAVLQFIADLRKQIDLAELEAKAAPHIQVLMAEAFTHARNFTTPTTMAIPWKNNLSNQLKPATMTAWAFAGVTLAATESLIPPDELQSIRTAIDELVKAANESAITDELRALILASTEELRTALAMYGIRGVESLEGQLEQMAGTIVLHKDVLAQSRHISPEATHGVMKAFGKLFGTVGNACRNASAINDVAQIAHTGYQKVAPVVTTLLEMLGSNGN